MTFTEEFKAKYAKKHINLPKNVTKKPSLSDCYSCERYERGPNLPRMGVVHWCVSKEFDQIKKRPVTHYANIELLKTCPKKIQKKQYG